MIRVYTARGAAGLRLVVYAVAVGALVACSDEAGVGKSAESTQPSGFDAAALALGSRRYAELCAQCHGPEAQGHPDWQTPNDGTFTAAPPLDASGNAPKRSKTQLAATIRQGVRRDGVDLMPAWGGRLSDAEIDAIIAWFQSLWPPAVYGAWQQQNQPGAADAAANASSR